MLTLATSRSSGVVETLDEIGIGAKYAVVTGSPHFAARIRRTFSSLPARSPKQDEQADHTPAPAGG